MAAGSNDQSKCQSGSATVALVQGSAGSLVSGSRMAACRTSGWAVRCTAGTPAIANRGPRSDVAVVVAVVVAAWDSEGAAEAVSEVVWEVVWGGVEEGVEVLGGDGVGDVVATDVREPVRLPEGEASYVRVRVRVGLGHADAVPVALRVCVAVAVSDRVC